MTSTAITAIQPMLITPKRHQHRHQPGTGAHAAQPEPETRPGGLAAALAEVPLERRELVSPGGDRHRADRGRCVRPVGRKHDGTRQCPDRQVRPGEQQHRAHHRRGRLATAGAAPGSIITIATHSAAQNANDPSRAATP